MGRKDAQVQISGKRVEITEVERVAAKYPGIERLAVVARQDKDTTYLTLFFESREFLDEKAVKQFLAQNLLSYKVPRFVVRLEQIPTNRHGKIDRKKLSDEPLENFQTNTHSNLNKATKTEKMLAHMISDITEMPLFSINTDDSLFDMGVDSVNALRLLQEIEKRWDIAPSAQDIFNNATLSALARFVDEEKGDCALALNKKHPCVLEIPSSRPVSSVIQELLLDDAIAQGSSTAYNNPFLLRLREDVDRKKLKAALQGVLKAQPNLFSTFRFEDNTFVQYFKKPYDIEIETLRCKDVKSASRKQIKPFNVEQELPFRVLFIEEKASKNMWIADDGGVSQKEERRNIQSSSSASPARYLFMDFHHAALDGTSFEILMNQIIMAYEQSTYPCIGYEEIRAVQDSRKDAIAFWRERAPYIFKVPTFVSDYPKKDVTGTQEIVEMLDQAMTENLEEFCRAHKITKFAFLLTVFELSVSLYARQKAFTFGVPFSGRTDKRLQQTLGMFVRTLPFSFQRATDANVSFLQLASQNMDLLKKYLMFQSTDILRCFREEGLSQELLHFSQVMFGYKRSEYEEGEKNSPFEEIIKPTSKDLLSDFLFYVYDVQGALSFSLEFKKKLFCPAQMHEFMALFTWLVQQVLEDASHTLETLRMLPREREKEILEHLSKAKSFMVPDEAPITLFKAMVDAHPDARALSVVRDAQKIQSLTYKELWHAAAHVAQELQTKASLWEAHKVVGIYASRNEEIIAAALGILISGNSFIYLDPAHPATRTRHLVKTLDVSAYIGEVGIQKDLKDLDDKRIYIPLVLRSALAAEVEKALTPAEQAQTCMFLSTSGSTGVPKVFPISQRGMINECIGEAKDLRLSSTSQILMTSNPNFDMFYITVFPALLAGAGVWMLDDETEKDLGLIDKIIQTYAIDNMFMTTLLGEQFIQWFPHSSLKRLSVAGEALSLVPETSFKVLNAYGPAEAGIVTRQAVSPELAPVPIGYPCNNMDVFVLDEKLRVVPPYCEGELFIAGPQLTTGYIGKDMVQTNKRVFRKNPYKTSTFDKTLYASGDLAFMDEAGVLYYAGRKDFQVKINGVRIQPEEIEACVLAHDAFDACCVLAVKKADGHDALALFYHENPSHKNAAGNDLVKKLILEHFPASHLPALIEEHQTFPLTKTGKVDKKVLLEEAYKHLAVVSKGTPLATRQEKELGSMLCATCSVPFDVLSREASFLDLGGDSIRSMSFAFQLQERFGVHITPKEVISTPSLKDLALLIEKRQAQKGFSWLSRDSKQKKTMVLIHTANSGSEAYRPLAELLKDKVNILVVEPHNIFHPTEKVVPIPELAAFYIDMLEKEGLGNFDYLGGWSFGGSVAYEMAAQYEKRGQKKKALFLLDPMFLQTKQEKEQFKALSESAAFLQYLENDPLFEKFINMGLIDRMVENQLDVAEAMISYTPSSYAGETTFFKSMKFNESYLNFTDSKQLPSQAVLKEFQERKTNLEGFASSVRIVEVDEEHDGFMNEEAVDKIASVIKRALNSQTASLKR